MAALAHKVEDVRCGLDIRRERVAQVGIEVREARTIDDEIERAAQALTNFGGEAQMRLAAVSLDYFHAFAQELRETLAVLRGEGLEYRRFLNDALESLESRGGAVSPNQQINSADVRKVGEQVREPHFGDEAGAGH